MSITYKDLLPDDISIQDFESHKEWNIHHLNTGSYGFSQHRAKIHSGFGAYYTSSQFFSSSGAQITGQSSTGSSTTGPIYDKLLYSSLANTFYQTGSLTQSANAVAHPRALEWRGNRITSGFYSTTATTMSIWQIASNIVGEEIKPGSISVSHSLAAQSFTDDSSGNLTATNGTQIGNVFYKSGIFVFTSESCDTVYADPEEVAGTGWRNIYFKGSLTMTEHEYYCTIQDGEFNQSVHPTILSGSNDGVAAGAEGSGSYILRSVASSSAFSPYITTVGLYNDSGDLCATGKLARPLKNSDQYDISIVVRFDA